jgi:molecular chaperone GrpE (heat shock protein)
MSAPHDNADEPIADDERPTPARRGVDTAAALEELADDMLAVMQRLAQIEQRQITLDEDVRGCASATTRSHEVLRRDLIGEQNTLALRQFVNTVAPALDSLVAMHQGLDSRDDARMQAQLTGVIAILENVLLGMGFRVFLPAAGEPFDAVRMESVGDREGAPGMVAETVRPGYLAGSLVIRPAAVLIGRASAVRSAETAD